MSVAPRGRTSTDRWAVLQPFRPPSAPTASNRRRQTLLEEGCTGQDLDAILRHHDRLLERGLDVRLLVEHLVEARLEGEAHPRLEDEVEAAVGHTGLLADRELAGVEANPVARVEPVVVVAETPRRPPDGRVDLRYPNPGLDRVDPGVHRLVIHAVELLEFLARLSREARPHTVAVVPLVDRPHVEHDRVAVLELAVRGIQGALGDRARREERIEPVAFRAKLVHASHEGAVDLVLRLARPNRLQPRLDALAGDPPRVAHELLLLLVLDCPREEERLFGVDELETGHRALERLEDDPREAVDADLPLRHAKLGESVFRPACVPLGDEVRVEDREVIPAGVLSEGGSFLLPVWAGDNERARIEKPDPLLAGDDRDRIRLPAVDEEPAKIREVLNVVVLRSD